MDEAKSNKSLKEQINVKDEKLNDLDEQMREKRNLFTYTRRAHELLEHVLFFVNLVLWYFRI